MTAEEGSEEPIGISPEVEAFAPTPGLVHLSNGVDLQIKKMRAREFFKLLKLLLRGSANLIPALMAQQDDSDFMGQLGAMLLWSIPEAPEETLEFVRSMIQPWEVIGPFNRQGFPTSPEGIVNQQKNVSIVNAMEDPEVEDVVAIVEAIILQEKDDMAALGKRFRGLMELGKKTGQIPVR